MKLSAVMVKAAVPLRMLAPFELEILSRVLFQYFSGLDEAHTKRWRRVWARLFQRDEVFQFYPVVARSGKFHRRHMAIEKRILAHQDAFLSEKPFRLWLKTGACFGNFEASAGQLVFVPSSLNYDDCSDDEMREFHADAMEFLRSPYALATLWPSMQPTQRPEMLELLLQNPEDEA